MKNNSMYGIRFLEMLFGVCMVAIGISLMIKSRLGQTAVTAFIQNIAVINGQKSGTVMIWFFLGCTFLQILILRQDFKSIQLLQVVLTIVQGKIVNLICYDIPGVARYFPQSYFLRLMFILVGISLTSYGITVLFTADLVKNPFEELAMVISRKIHMDYGRLRIYADFFFLAMCYLMIMEFHLEITTLREGTWISALLLGRSMKYTFPLARKTSLYYKKTLCSSK